MWQVVAWTFVRGRVRQLDGGALFYRDGVSCRVYELNDSYGITTCDAEE